MVVVGIDPALQDEVAPVSSTLLPGQYLTLRSEEVVIAANLAAELQVATGDRLRLTSSTGTSDTVTIVGIYSAGSEVTYVTLRTAQRLLGAGACRQHDLGEAGRRVRSGSGGGLPHGTAPIRGPSLVA